MQIIRQIQEVYIHYLFRLVSFCMRRPAAVLALGMGCAAACVGYSVFNLPINSKQEQLISRENEFLKREEVFSKAFPHQDHTIVVLVSGADLWQVSRSTERLANALRGQPDLFKSVFYPQDTDFFRQNGLLYLDTEKLIEFVDGLATAQPAIAQLAADPNLRGLFTLLQDGLKAESDASINVPEDFDIILRHIAAAIEEFLAGRTARDIWNAAFPSGLDQSHEEYPDALQVIIVQPHLDFSNFLSGKKAINSLRDIASDLRLQEKGIQVRLTGREPLTFDELASILFNIEVAGVISVIAIIVILGFGIRSWRMIAMIMAALFTGIGWSFGWATISVGELNMISTAFVVLFLGISVDFSIHVALRYREEMRKIDGRSPVDAMRKTIHGTGGAISLCGLATAAGFLSFAPTEYFALRDLGIIAGGSMFLALLASFTILPALLTYLPLTDIKRLSPGESKKIDIIGNFSVVLYEWIRRYFRPITLSAVVLALAVLPLALQMKFDHSALAIKDPYSESITSLQELQARGFYTDYTAAILVENRSAAEEGVKKLSSLPLVRMTETYKNFTPKNQDEKIEVLAEAAFFMAPVFSADRLKPPSTADFERTTRNLIRVLAVRKKEGTLSADQQRLGKALTALLRHPDGQSVIERLNAILTEDFPERLARLERSLEAEPFSFDDLPENVRAQTQAADGRIKITIYPQEDMTDPDALARFVKTVTQASQNVGGRPVVEYAVGQIVVRSFQTALGLAIMTITLILLLSLRSIRNTALVLAPIALAGTYTLAACVWLDISFNFVNVLLLPLLLGLGVANGIHILSRTQTEKNVREVMHSSTPVAVFLSNATTLATFGSLMVTTHLGMRSMGTTLSISMIFMIICALIILPAILAWMRHHEQPD